MQACIVRLEGFYIPENFMKRIFFVIFLFFIQAVSAQNVCMDTAGNFSFVMPDGWAAVTLNGVQYRTAAGITINGFTQNITAMREKFAGTLDEYLEEAKKHLIAQDGELQIFKEEVFTTAENLEGRKIVFDCIYSTLSLKQYVYIFQVENICFLFTCSVAADEPEEIEEVFDESMKTFRTLRKELHSSEVKK